jgi:hypothetical protein
MEENLIVTETFSFRGRTYSKGMVLAADAYSALGPEYMPQAHFPDNFREETEADRAEIRAVIADLARESKQRARSGDGRRLIQNRVGPDRVRSELAPDRLRSESTPRRTREKLSVITHTELGSVTFDLVAGRAFQEIEWTREYEQAFGLYGVVDGDDVHVNGVFSLTGEADVHAVKVDLDRMHEFSRPHSYLVGTAHSHPGLGETEPSSVDLRHWAANVETYRRAFAGLIVAPNADPYFNQWGSRYLNAQVGGYMATPTSVRSGLVQKTPIKFHPDTQNPHVR